MQFLNINHHNPVVQTNIQDASLNTLKTADFKYIDYDDKVNKKESFEPSNMLSTTKLSGEKFVNALTRYTVKGATGNRDANFYEFLAMGMIPYLIGSGVMIALYNSVNKLLKNKDKAIAQKIGLKAGLGVVFYGLARHFSKRLVEEPVELATGIDMNLPCRINVKERPTKENDDPERQEIHYAYESVEFPRTDLLFNYNGDVRQVNEKYDKIAKKLGYDTKLQDSDQVVKPKVKEVATKTMSVTYITKYMWAALGVALAFQKPWETFIDEKSKIVVSDFPSFCQKWKEKFISLKQAAVHSARDLYCGTEKSSKCERFLGKFLVLSTVLSTVAGTAWIIMSSKDKKSQSPEKHNIDTTKEYSVS